MASEVCESPLLFGTVKHGATSNMNDVRNITKKNVRQHPFLSSELLISYNPLVTLHLPRLWQKNSLDFRSVVLSLQREILPSAINLREACELLDFLVKVKLGNLNH